MTLMRYLYKKDISLQMRLLTSIELHFLQPERVKSKSNLEKLTTLLRIII